MLLVKSESTISRSGWQIETTIPTIRNTRTRLKKLFALTTRKKSLRQNPRTLISDRTREIRTPWPIFLWIYNPLIGLRHLSDVLRTCFLVIPFTLHTRKNMRCIKHRPQLYVLQTRTAKLALSLLN